MSNGPKVNTISSDDRLWAALTYIFSPLIPIILLVLDDFKDRSYIRYHSIQALVVGIILAILVPIIAILTAGCGGGSDRRACR